MIKVINIIDFLDNFELDFEEQCLIMYLFWQKIKFIVGRKCVDVWFFFDEIQDFIGMVGEVSCYNFVWKVMEEIYRKGCFFLVNVVVGIQYFYKLLMSFIMGVVYIVVIGVLVSLKDFDIFCVVIMDGEWLRILVEYDSFEEFLKCCKKKGCGWFLFDCEFIVKMYFCFN